jgi:hypothetical protein
MDGRLINPYHLNRAIGMFRSRRGGDQGNYLATIKIFLDRMLFHVLHIVTLQ